LQYLLHNFSRFSENSSFNPILRGDFTVFIKKYGISTEMGWICADFEGFFAALEEKNFESAKL